MFAKKYKFNGFILLLASYVYYIRNNQKDILNLTYNQQSKKMMKVIDQLKNFEFKPSFFSKINHLQVLFNGLMSNSMRQQCPFKYDRELFVYKDGGTIALDWMENIPEQNEEKPILILLPGLTADNKGIYTINIFREAKQMGFNCVCVNYRGASGVDLTSGQLYCAGIESSADFNEIFQYISQKYQNNQLYVVGVSMGGNIIGNFLAMYDCKRVQASCLIQPCINMVKTAQNINTQVFGLYNYLFGLNLIKTMKKFQTKLRDPCQQKNIDLDKCLKNLKYCTDIDNEITAPFFGYKNNQDYYEKASCKNTISNITSPTFILLSNDDPIIGQYNLNDEINDLNENILFGITKYGGHLGYFESFSSSKQWFTKPMFTFFQQFQK